MLLNHGFKLYLPEWFFFFAKTFIFEREREKKKNELFFLSLIAGKYFFFLTFHSVSLAFMPSCVH